MSSFNERLDQAIIDRHDKMTTYAQRRGLLLTEIKLQTILATITSHSAWAWSSDRLGSFIFGLVIFSPVLIGRYIDANRYRDYPESAKTIEKLNAAAVRARETPLYRFMRLMMFYLAAAMWTGSILEILLGTGPSFAASVAFMAYAMVLVPAMYLDCCLYLGPGEFAKKRREKLEAQAEASKSPL